MKHKLFILSLIIIASILLSGCWDRAELQDLDLVSAIGIDEGGDNVENRYRVTVQILNESQLAGAAGTPDVLQRSPVTTFSNTGSTIAEALRKISSKSPHELFYPHVRLMVIGEEIARKKGIEELFDMIERDAQFRTLFPVLVVRDNTAKQLLQVTTPLEKVPTEKLVGALETTKKVWGEYASASTRADQVIKQLGNNVANLAGVQINGDPEKGNRLTNIQQIAAKTNLEIKGIAIFKNGKLKKWLDEDTARGVTWINNEMTKTVVDLSCDKKKKGVAIDMMRSKSKIKVKIKNNKPVIDLRVRAEGHITEVQCPIDLSKHETFEKLEKKLEKEIKEEVFMALEAAKKQKSDIFRFGEYVNREDPKLWKKIEKRWNDEIFPETKVNVTVKGFIRRSGLRTKTYSR
ncbi:Ger(x)C family spore germination protein [Bacillus sp. 03113]|uniref:Ger(x)C family spore germination protein n=1 Tax=Bacillus sp. 03113 TaxID=2578211 RepID=UPI001141FD44|nr:Ger(x)C family spore germination protein [Bacillus sp. 03113]